LWIVHAHLLHPGCEVGLQSQQVVGGADQAVQSRLVQSHVGEEHLLVVIRQVGNFGFHARTERHDRCVFPGGLLLYQLQQRIVVAESVLCDVGGIQRRLGGNQAQRLDVRQLLPRKIECAHGFGLVKLRLRFLQHGNQQLRFLVAGLRRLAIAGERLVHRGKIRQRQFGLDRFDVGKRINFSGDVRDIVVGEAAYHVHHRIGFTDVSEKLVAQTFAFGGARHQTGDVHELHDRCNHFLRPGDGGELCQPGIRHCDDADIRLDGAERIVLSRDARLGERVEQRGLADIGQTDDTAFETHRIG
jgi:hypothetical protein